MTEPRTLATVRFTSEGLHQWLGAPKNRYYLAFPHRHLFHVEAQVQVFHDDREIEFQDLLDFCLGVFPSGDLGTSSCEMLAKGLFSKLVSRYGADRYICVSVFEDGEMGATVCSV